MLFGDSFLMRPEGRGTHFDPAVFDAFVAAIEEVREVYETYKEV